MYNTCDCYRTRERQAPRYSPTSGGYIGCVTETVSYCIGTKEQEECSCGGDRSKCDFYPERRTDSSVDTLKYENEQLSKSYDAMLRDLQFRVRQLREAQEEIDRLREQNRVLLSELEELSLKNVHLEAEIGTLKESMQNWHEED